MPATFTPNGIDIDLNCSDEEFEAIMARLRHESGGEDIDARPFQPDYATQIHRQYQEEAKPVGRRETVCVELMSRADVMLGRIDAISTGIHRIQSRSLR